MGVNEILEEKNILLEFEAISDVHISSDDENSQATVNFVDAIDSIKKYFPKSVGIMGSGDFTDNGYEEQFKGYYDILEKHGDGLIFLNALGNHDVRWKSGWDEIYNRYMKYNSPYMGETNGKVYHDKWIKGYHFIVLNTEWDIKDRAYISPEQLEWLDKTMANGAKDDKPIFLFLHQALRDTYWNSNEWDVGVQDFELKQVLRKYPQLIMFTGHIHNGLGALDVVRTEYGTMVDVPGFYLNDYGDSRGQIGYHVSVYDDKVKISMWDYKDNKWIPEYNHIIDFNTKNYELDSDLGDKITRAIDKPYKLQVEATEAIISWEPKANESVEPAYLVLNGKKYADIESNESSKRITGLNQNEKYTVLLVNREKAIRNNYRDVYPFVFTTKDDK